MTILARVLSILFGALPATLICGLAVPGVVVAAITMLSGDSDGLLLFAWGAPCIYGTVALWAISDGHVRPWVVVGLVVVIALSLVTCLLNGPYDLRRPGDILGLTLFMGPSVVAFSWLGALFAKAYRQTPATTDTGDDILRNAPAGASTPIAKSDSYAPSETS